MENELKKEEITRLKDELKSATELVASLQKKLESLENEENENIEKIPKRVYDKEILENLEQQIKNFFPIPHSFLNPIMILNHSSNKARLIVTINNVLDNEKTNSAIKKIEEWFMSLEEEAFLDFDKLLSLYKEKLNEFDVEIGNLNSFNSSYSSTLLTGDKTIVSRFGDIPIYVFENAQISLLGQLNKDEFEFTVLDDKNYTTLILFSNGVAESIEDDKIKIVTRLTSREELAEELLESTTNIPLSEIQSMI